MFAYALVLLFLIRIRFPRNTPINEIIIRRYGRPVLQQYRSVEKNYFKMRKLEDDIRFLNLCKDYNIIPKFLKFKVYNVRLYTTKLYRSWLFKLLDTEIRNQSKKLKNCVNVYESTMNELKVVLSYIDFKCLTSIAKSNGDKKMINVLITHNRKLKDLGVDVSKGVDCNKVIFNLSNRVLTEEEKNVLSLGLEFGLKPSKISFFRYFLNFEKLCGILKNCNKYGTESWNVVFNKISVIANNSYKNFYRNKHSDPINDKRVEILKSLRDDDNIIITRPDKGKGVVIVDKDNYIERMKTILGDFTKFRILKTNISAHILKLEDKLNRLLRTLKPLIGEIAYNNIYISGSKPGSLYGLPKIHKVGNPFRPIVSSIGTFNYNLAKFLVPIISPLTSNEHTIDNSTKFVNELVGSDLPHNFVMASFDVESLFTNVPLKETTDIIIDKLVNGDFDTRGLNREQLKKLLNIATSESVFMFDNELYSQIDGVCMGSCLGPTYANAFLCHFEDIWLNECPVTFKPLYYRRYIDDTFLIFKDVSHIQLFLNYLNAKHPNIRFTCEMENNSKLSFLDTELMKENGKLVTSTYRKPTFTGLGLNYLSYSPYLYKVNSIKTLINRAYNICSNYFTLDKELKFLKTFFECNAFPSFLFARILRQFLNDKFSPKSIVHTALKDRKYIKLPYLGHISFSVRNQLNIILRQSFPQVDFRFVFTNQFTISSLLKKPKPRPFDLTSGSVYSFSCPRCNARYVGSSTRWLQHRISDHKGISIRTGYPLSTPMYSAIREHSETHDHAFTYKDFKILNTASFRTDLLILESLYISKMKPNLNNTTTAHQLYTQ